MFSFYNIHIFKEVPVKQDKKCALSGILLKFGRSENVYETTASLDRIDNKKGYTENNVQWVFKDINVMKNIHDQEYFLLLCSKIAKHSPPEKEPSNDSEIFNRGRYRTY